MEGHDSHGEDSGWTWSHGIIIFSGEWTWLAMLLFMAIPFGLLLLFTEKAALFFARHVIIIGVAYMIASLVLAAVIYLPHGRRWRAAGFLAVLLTMLPTLFALVFYIVPFEVLDPGFDAIFDFFLLMLIYLGGAALIMAISRLLKNGLKHLAMAVVYFVLCIFFLRFAISTERELLTMEAIRAVYGA